jgi:hypothetical protein
MKMLCSGVLFILCLVPVSLHSEVYMWTDKNGVKHFSNTGLSEEVSSADQKEEIEFDAEKAAYYQSIREKEEQQRADQAAYERKRELEKIKEKETALKEKHQREKEHTDAKIEALEKRIKEAEEEAEEAKEESLKVKRALHKRLKKASQKAKK